MAPKKKTLADYRADNADLRASLKNTRAELAEANGAIARLTSGNHAANQARNDLEEQLSNAVRQSKQLIEERDAAEKDRLSALDHIEELQAACRAEKAMVIQKENENETLRRQLEKQDHAYAMANKRAGEHEAAKVALLEAVYRLGQGLGEK